MIAGIALATVAGQPPRLYSELRSRMLPLVRTLFVAWQEPESRRIYPVARLTRRRNGEYELRYIGAVWAAREQGFRGLPGLEEIEAVHVSAELPAVFGSRPVRRRRASEPAEAAT